MKKLLKFLKDEEGIEMVEWAIMAALFALVVAAAIPGVTTAVSTGYGKIAAAVTGP